MAGSENEPVGASQASASVSTARSSGSSARNESMTGRWSSTGHHHPGAAVLEEVSQLIAGEPRVQRQGDRRRVERSQVGRQERQLLRRRDGHPVPRFDPQFTQPPGTAPGFRIKIAISQGVILVMQCHSVGLGGERRPQFVEEVSRPLRATSLNCLGHRPLLLTLPCTCCFNGNGTPTLPDEPCASRFRIYPESSARCRCPNSRACIACPLLSPGAASLEGHQEREQVVQFLHGQ